MNGSPPVGTPPPLAARPRNAGAAIAALVLGIVSLVCCMNILTGLPAVICGIIALNKINESRGALGGRGMAIAGLTTGGVGIVLAVAMLPAMILPATMQARNRAREVSCMNNVRQLDLACIQYAQEKNGTLPLAWDELKPYVGGDEGLKRLLSCPAHRGSGAVDYTLEEGGRKIGDIQQPAGTVIVRETGPGHNGRRNVGFADGHVESQGSQLQPAGAAVPMPEPAVEAAPK